MDDRRVVHIQVRSINYRLFLDDSIIHSRNYLCSFMSSILVQPPFLSIISGIIAVVIYHFCGPKMAPPKEQAGRKTAVTAQTKSYLMVFLVVAVLVYGSFVIAESGGGVKYATPQAEIQTGGRPPF